jgi:hypothetical protein
VIDQFTLDASVIALAIEALVMRRGDVGQMMETADAAQDRVKKAGCRRMTTSSSSSFQACRAPGSTPQLAEIVQERGYEGPAAAEASIPAVPIATAAGDADRMASRQGDLASMTFANASATSRADPSAMTTAGRLDGAQMVELVAIAEPPERGIPGPTSRHQPVPGRTTSSGASAICAPCVRRNC